MRDYHIARSGLWTLEADKLQWILVRRRRALSFVSSTRDILERCMREKGCPEAHRAVLLAGLPSTFAEWKKALPGGQERL
jgi:hypothetical protein